MGFTASFAWETLPITEVELANYLHANPRLLDPIEGIWIAYGPVTHRIAITRNASKPGRDFIGFLLNTENPTWRAGYKKIDIKAGPKPGIYLFDYYLDDFSKRATTVILGKNATFTLNIPTSEEKADLITYARSH